jgi:hypothetical protein
MEGQFGLLYTTFAPKPAYYAFKAYATSHGGDPPPPPPPPPDHAPVVQLTSPADGGTFTNTLSFSATASDDHGVRSVRFLVDGKEVGRDAKAPYSFRWKAPAGLSYGAHTVSAVAVDTAGQSTTVSKTVTRIRARRAFHSRAGRLRVRHVLVRRAHRSAARLHRR